MLTHLSNLVAHCAPRGDRATRRNIERVVFEVRIEMAYVNSMIMCGLPLLLISTIQLLPRRLRIVFSIAFCQQHLPVRLVSAATKSRWKFYALVQRLSFRTTWASRRHRILGIK